MKLGGHDFIQHHFYRVKNTELSEIYASNSIKTFATALVGIFIPIYLLNLGYSLQIVLLVEIFMFGLEFFLELPAAYFVSKFGPKHAIAFSMPFYIIHFIFLWLLPSINIPFWTLSISGAIALAFFWEGYHWDFSHAKHKFSATKEIGKMNILSILVAASAPLVGGFIGNRIGMHYVFLLTAILIIGSVFPLFKTSEPHRSKKLKFSKVKTKLIWRDLISYGGYGVQTIMGSIIWPIFIYTVLKNYQSLGLVTTFSMLLAISVTYFVSKKADHKERKRFVKSGSFLMGLIYFAKALANTIFHIFSLDVLTSLANSISLAPFQSEYYLHADEESRSEYIAYMEATIDIFRVMALSLLLAASYLLNVKYILMTGLVLGGIGSFLMVLMPPAKCELNLEGASIKIVPRPLKRKVTV